MFGFFNKKEDPNRKILREQFEATTTALRATDDLVQMAVGHSINIANSIFVKRYSSLSEFQQLPKNERVLYIRKLTDMENKLAEKGDHHTLLGFSLFKMWVGAAAEIDTELMDLFSNQLAYFSKKGDLPV
ncbi:hypothetical protein [Photobacterium kishitanii]|uniref:hypothetical protein n=1 Tax=Photobacterium kishitanii TaxID=318456 RepID=UPI000430EAF5|nr:hypothetical protein [Photobacterium kishitanii]CEO38673.1 conserved hypothetical protein [Photobacterium kishitanii]